jgi:two-component system, CitB family, response regulator MalR
MKKINQVLIIDDDEINNLFCTIIIEHLGIAGDVHCCTNGSEAFDYLDSCLKYNKLPPDLILLDINMPLMNGLEFLEKYHSERYHEMIQSKISMLSSSDMASDIETAFKYDSVIDYLTKPLSEVGLNRVLQKLS